MSFVRVPDFADGYRLRLPGVKLGTASIRPLLNNTWVSADGSSCRNFDHLALDDAIKGGVLSVNVQTVSNSVADVQEKYFY